MRRYETMTADFGSVGADWLAEGKVTHVAMESNGSVLAARSITCWKGAFEL